MSDGWIKLHRKLYDNPYASDPHWVALWIWILCKASRGGNEVLFNGERRKLEPGEFTAGRKQMSKETGINESKIYRLLECYKSEQQIEQLTSPRTSLFKVLGWDRYQEVNSSVNRKRTAREQLVNTKQEVENKRIVEVVEDGVLIFACSGSQSEWHLTQSQVDEWAEAFPGVDILGECRRAKAWTEANTKKTHGGMRRFLVNWLNKAVDSNRHLRSRPQQQPQQQPQQAAAGKSEGTWAIKTRLDAVTERISQLRSYSPGAHCELFDFLNEEQRQEWINLHKQKKQLETKLTS